MVEKEERISPYSETFLEKRDLDKNYYLSTETVRKIKLDTLITIFDRPGDDLGSLEEELAGWLEIGMAVNLSPSDLEECSREITRGLVQDGELIIRRQQNYAYPVLTVNGLNRVAEIKKRELESQIKDLEDKVQAYTL